MSELGPNASPVFSTWDAAFSVDPLGDRGWLSTPYQEFALIWNYVAGGTNAWVFQRDSVTLTDHGETEEAPECGFTGVQQFTNTSLFPGGYESTMAYYAVTDLGLRISSVPYSVTYAATMAGTSAVVPRVGTTLNNAQGIAGILTQTAMEGADITFSQTGRTCKALLGKPEFHPSGTAFASQNNVTNGEVIGCGIRQPLKRTLIMPPGTQSQIGNVFTIEFQDKQAVAADPSFAAPAATDVCVIKGLATFGGFFCDDAGLPLVQLASASSGGDFAEQKAAAKYAAA
jgi:hypothetical protein